MSSLSNREVLATDLRESPPGVSPVEKWPIGAAMMAFARPLMSYAEASDPLEHCREDLSEVAHAGFDHVDVTDNWLRPGDLDARQVENLIVSLNAAGLAISAISVTRRSIIDPDREVADANLEYALRTVEAAAQLEVPVVCLGLHRPLLPEQLAAQWFWHAPGAVDSHDPAVRKQAVDGFRRVGERAGELGVDISLEMYEDTLLGSAEGCVDLVRDIGLPNVGLNPDIGNLVRLHRPVEDWESMLRTMLPHTNYWHVKNYFRDFDPATGSYFSAPAPLETGYINYRHAIQMALDVGFSGPFCVEHYGGDGLSVAAMNRDYLRRILAAKWARLS